MKRIVFLSAAVSALALTACAGSEETAEENGSGAAAVADDGQSGGTLAVVTEKSAVFAGAAMPEGEGEAFLTAFSEVPSVTVMENGLAIQTLTEGEGVSPRATDLIRVNFSAAVAGAGEDFESTWENGSPVIVTPEQTLPGWSQALQTMKKGGRARVVLPAALAFGEQGMPGGPVGPGAVTVYDFELLDIYAADNEEELTRLQNETQGQIDALTEEATRLQGLAQQQFAALGLVNTARGNRFIASQAARPETLITPTGLVYEVITDGGSEGAPAIGDTVTVNYRGTLPDGTEFDSSYSRGEPSSFELGRVIQGWNEGLQLMQPGDTYRFYIPAELGYGREGAGGSIGPNQALVFDVELIEVAPAPAEAPAE